MKRAIILINAYSNLPSSLNQAERLQSEFKSLSVECDIVRNALLTRTDDKGEIFSKIGGYDFGIYLDKDDYTPNMLELSGLRLFNCARAVRLCDDKMLTHICLSGHGIPMPATIPAPLCYDKDKPVPEKFLDEIEGVLGYPVIVKNSYGSLGKGVFKADDRRQLKELCERLKCSAHLFQKCVKESLGADIRVIVIGNKAVAAMKRTSDGDFRSNLELGGKGEIYPLDSELKSLCERAAAVLGLDFCGIDVLISNDGYLLCEVNSNAFFGGIERVTGTNVAKLYCEYIYDKIYGKN